MSETAYRRTKTVIILLFFAFCLFTCVYLRIQDAPDEDMRYMIPKYIYTHHALRSARLSGTEPELRHSIWGIFLCPLSISFFHYQRIFLCSWHPLSLQIQRFCCWPPALQVYWPEQPLLFIVFKIGELLFKKKESVSAFCSPVFLPSAVSLYLLLPE